MTVVLVWMTWSHRLYDLFLFFWHWVGVVGMGWVGKCLSFAWDTEISMVFRAL